MARVGGSERESRGSALLAGAVVAMVGLAGCTALREDPVNCKVVAGLAGGAIGAAAGAVGVVDQIDSSPENLTRAGGGAAGFLIGGAAGYALGHFLCPSAPEPTPAPPPPPAAAPAPTPVPRRKLVLRGVTFDFDRAALQPAALPVLDEAATQLADAPAARVAVVGHTDAIGTDDYNQRLSERRARAVADYLVARGIDVARLDVAGRGENEPVADNSNPDGRAQNRRVELHVQD
jgi:outer membrane protein OmpA-like peptidoglycan-associated protein